MLTECSLCQAPIQNLYISVALPRAIEDLLFEETEGHKHEETCTGSHGVASRAGA